MGLESVIRMVAGGHRIRTRDAGVLGEQRKLKRSFVLAVPPQLFPQIFQKLILSPATGHLLSDPFLICLI